MRQNTLFALTLLSGTALATAAFAQTDARTASRQQSCDELTRVADANAERFQTAWVDGARAAVQRGDAVLCAAYVERAEEALGNDRSADAGARIVVEQPEPRVTVEQDAPDITVRQNDPQVSIDQGQPEIIVRQAEPTVRVEVPQPTITIDQPEPEIIVRMPEPDVAVTTPQPDIAVSQSEPEVTVEQAEPQIDIVAGDGGSGAAVEVTRDQAVVHQQDTGGEPEVNVQRAEPNVTYEAAEPNVQVIDEGTPNVQFTETGEPNVTLEPLDRQAEQAAPEAGTGPAAEDSANAATPGGEAPSPAAPTTADTAAPPGDETAGVDEPAPMMQVASFLGRTVHGSEGEEIGTIDSLVTDGNDIYAVITYGGFLGLGARMVAIPTSMLSVSDDRQAFIARGLTQQDVEAMPDLDTSAVQELPENQDVPSGQS